MGDAGGDPSWARVAPVTAAQLGILSLVVGPITFIFAVQMSQSDPDPVSIFVGLNVWNLKYTWT